MKCATCPLNVQKVRRCKEDRFDFTEEDNGAAFPMYVEQGGEMYGFCPGKATWDANATEIFRMLIITAETGTMLEEGGLYDQSSLWIELLSEFLPRYDDHKFYSRAKSILGEVQTGRSVSGKQ